MRPPDETRAAREATIASAKEAVREGRYGDAFRHLKEAEQLGVASGEIDNLRHSIDARKKKSRGVLRKSAWGGFAVAGIGYLILSFQQPPAWGIPVWAALAFLLVPAGAGYAASRIQGPGIEGQARFAAAMRGVGWAMFFYTLLSLFVLLLRMGGEGRGAQVGLVIFVLSVVYALLAGGVAGLAAKILGPRIVAKRRAETLHGRQA